MTNIAVKDISGDVKHYIADSFDILDNGDLCITCGSETTVYNADHVIYHSVNDADIGYIYSTSEVAKYEHNNI